MRLDELHQNEFDKALALFTAKENGDLFYKNHFINNYGDKEEALELIPDAVIGPGGVEYINNKSGLPYIHEIHNVVIGPSYVVGEYLYKATDNIKSPQVPGFMTDEGSVQQYLPGGARYKHHGGDHLIRAKIDKIDKMSEPELIDTANFGFVFILPGTPSVLDFGENDGILILQNLAVEVDR